MNSTYIKEVMKLGRGMYKRKVRNNTEVILTPEQNIIDPLPPKKQPKYLRKVKVTHPSLRMRKAPDSGAEVIGLITDQGEYGLLEVKDGWGKLDNGAWIMLQYTQQIK